MDFVSGMLVCVLIVWWIWLACSLLAYLLDR